MRVPTWLADTRTSYDTVAESYADYVRDALAGERYMRGIAGFTVEAQLVLNPDDEVPWAALFARVDPTTGRSASG
jgi:hypothetical protein